MNDRQMIPVVIFSGGKGSRLKEETEFRPKPMVTIGGRPILWHIMKGYANFGYRRFIIALGYKSHMIKDYFLQHQLFTSDFHLNTASRETKIEDRKDNDDFQITFAETGEETLTGERLLKVMKYIDTDQFMVTYGDGISDIDVSKLHDFHNQKEKDLGVIGTVTGVHPRSKYGLFTADENKKLLEFRQKPVIQEYTNGGFMVFNKGFAKYLKEDQMVEDAMIDAVNDGKLCVYHYDGFWHCMDTHQDMEALNKMWEEDPKWRTWS